MCSISIYVCVENYNRIKENINIDKIEDLNTEGGVLELKKTKPHFGFSFEIFPNHIMLYLINSHKSGSGI